jgi:hypothetical protein
VEQQRDVPRGDAQRARHVLAGLLLKHAEEVSRGVEITTPPSRATLRFGVREVARNLGLATKERLARLLPLDDGTRAMVR